MAAADLPKSEWPVIQRAEVEAFVTRCVQAVGVSEKHGNALAEILALADYRGHYSHGLNRLGTSRDLKVKSFKNSLKTFFK